MKTAIFTLPGSREDYPGEGPNVVINNRYVFVEGELTATEEDGVKLEPILCGYYGCRLDWRDDTPVVEFGENNPTLAKSSTSKSANTSNAKALAEQKALDEKAAADKAAADKAAADKVAAESKAETKSEGK